MLSFIAFLVKWFVFGAILAGLVYVMLFCVVLLAKVADKWSKYIYDRFANKLENYFDRKKK